MANRFVQARLEGIQTILSGVHQSSVGLSSATKGGERAAFIDQFLAKVLPPIYRFGTGDVTDADGNKSGQLDVVVEYPVAPSLPIVGAGQSRLYLAESVAAVIEVKSNLADQWDEVRRTADALAMVRRRLNLLMSFGDSPSDKIPFFAVGYEGWTNIDTLHQKLASSPSVTGALVIKRGLYASNRCSALDSWALWGLICDLQQVTNSLHAADPEPFRYLANNS